MSVTINDSGEGAMPKFEAVMAMKNAEIGELRQRAEQLQRDYEAAREACQRGRQTEEALTHQLAKADDRNVKLRQRAARAEAECERLRGIIYGVAFNLDHDAPRDIIVRCRESLTAALSPAPAAENLDALIEQARAVTMTPEQAEAQRQSFARGNVAIDNQSDSRKTIPAPSPDKENGR